jgi:hypothetical protein
MWTNFTNVQISESLGFIWYYPNGTEYSNSTGTLQSGYAWIAEYDEVTFGGTSAASVTGAWSVSVYVGGAEILDQPFYVGNYSSPLEISFSALSPTTNSTHYPINSTIYYTPSSAQVNSFVLFSNIGKGSYSITFEFVTPQGTDYATVNAGSITGPSASIYVYSSMDVNGYPAASDPGWWKLLVFINNNFSSPALVQSFNISS